MKGGDEEKSPSKASDDDLPDIPDEGPPPCIRDRISEIEKMPLYSEKITIVSVIPEYTIDDLIYRRKLEELASKFTYVRAVRRDGNCFYRAFAFRFFELFRDNKQKMEHFKQKTSEYGQKLLKLGYSEITIDDFQNTVVQFVDSLGNGEDLITTLGDRTTSLCDYVVVMFRLFVSAYLQENAEFFQAFIEGNESVKAFCSNQVEPMNTEADHIHILALTSVLSTPVEVVYMDRTAGGLNHHVSPEGESADIKLLYRPSHYDILY